MFISVAIFSLLYNLCCLSYPHFILIIVAYTLNLVWELIPINACRSTIKCYFCLLLFIQILILNKSYFHDFSYALRIQVFFNLLCKKLDRQIENRQTEPYPYIIYAQKTQLENRMLHWRC